MAGVDATLWAEFRGGAFDGNRVEFALGITDNIGPQGSGKSTVVLSILFGLGIEPPPYLAEYANGKVEANLTGGEIRIGINASGVPYTLARAADAVLPTVTNAAGDVVDVSLDSD